MLTKQRKIQHLYWRAGFGITNELLNKKLNLPIQKIVNDLFSANKSINFINLNLGEVKDYSKFSEKEKITLRAEERKNIMKINATWVKQMATTQNPLLERMTLFWHGHFACINRSRSHLTQSQNNTIRKHALGNFKDLLIAIAKDPSMIRFLNNQQNKKGQPNENFARELLELFTIGRGNYTEKDIKEAARAFTGWFSNSQLEFFFNKKHHDFGDKVFFGETGDFNGEDIINIILKKKETARFICTKVYQYFVNSTVDQSHINRLTNVFFNSNYDIKTLMKTIFASDWFYEYRNIGTKIKSPIDLLVGVMQTLSVEFEEQKTILFIQKVLGQTLFDPPNVAGWAGGQAWIDNSTLLFRLNLVNYLLQATDLEITTKPEFEALKNNNVIKQLGATVHIDAITKQLKNKNEFVIFKELKNWLIQPKSKLTKAELDLFTINNNRTDYIQSLIIRLMTLPEYQMC